MNNARKKLFCFRKVCKYHIFYYFNKIITLDNYITYLLKCLI